MTITAATIQSALAHYVIPDTDTLLVDVARITMVESPSGGCCVRIALRVGFSPAVRSTMESDIQACCRSVIDGAALSIEWVLNIRSHGQPSDKKALANVRNVIAVASGKGGVGKSTTSVNLACSLAQQGCRVGILDADIYGPNQPTMLGVSDITESKEARLEPIEAHGVYSMSMGYLVGVDQPMVWRGPMVSKVLTQLLQQTVWPALDFLIIDMPPGTGDVQLTLSKVVRLTGALIVSTPQDVALYDARKAIQMFHKVSIPVLGVIENMSTHICTACGHESALFGTGGAVAMADAESIPVLGQLPLSLPIREAADQGQPIVCGEPAGELAQRYHRIATQLCVEVTKLPVNYDHHFNVSVESDTSATGE